MFCIEENRLLCPFPFWMKKLHMYNESCRHYEINLNLKPITKLLNPVKVLNRIIPCKIVFLNGVFCRFEIIYRNLIF